ncbi:VWA domain-containing protein [Candidatus Sumerlaeota bacterium]|nr:VWA domain-containing protein [Candidatus Sumerlaeota bacterium]
MKRLPITKLGVAMAVVPILLAAAAEARVRTDDAVRIDVAIDKPVLLANEAQTAYVRVAIVGVPRPSAEERAPVNMAIVIDKSGSMRGEKIEKARDAAIQAVKRLGPDDIVSIVLYDTTVQVLVPATKLTDKGPVIDAIRGIGVGGRTALFAGVSKGAQEMRKFIDEERINRLLLLSDGLANIGPSSPGDLEDLGTSLLKEGISVVTIGLGLDYNEDLMSALAYKSDGAHYFVERPSELAGVFDRELGKAMSVVAGDIEAEFICAPGVRPVRVLGRQAEIDGRRARVFINHIYSEREKSIVLEVEIPPTDESVTRPVASVNVRYDNLATRSRESQEERIEANFTRSKELIDKRTDATVMVDVVQLIGAERNIKAMELRDKGQTEQARKILYDNNAYLLSNSAILKAPELEAQAVQNTIDAESLDEGRYESRRKAMQMNQTQWKLQE